MVAKNNQAFHNHHTYFNMHWDVLFYCGGVHLLSSLQDSVRKCILYIIYTGRDLRMKHFYLDPVSYKNDAGYFLLGSHFQGYSYSISC